MANIILVGVYDSETSHKVGETAARLAAESDAKLYVFSAFDKSEVEIYQVGESTIEVNSADGAEAVANRVADELRRFAPGIDIESGSLYGKPADALIDEAKRLDARLIVVGNKRMQGATRVLGSVANSIGHHAPCDVYIVKSSS